MRYITIKPRRGLCHATSEGSEVMGYTLCGKRATAWLVMDCAPTCLKCLQKIERALKKSKKTT